MKLQDIKNSPLVRIKEEDGLAIVKYSRKCFYDNVWNNASLNSRGHVYDITTGELIVRPFAKIFNHGENRTGFLTDGPYFVQDKINGFMGSVTKHNGKLIYSTTGSLSSDFVALLQREVEKVPNLTKAFLDGFTYIFEVCVPEDPHIIPEREGLHFLCRIHIKTGIHYPFPNELKSFKFFVPHYYMMNKEGVLQLSKHRDIEGYVIWECHAGEKIARPSFKIKTTDYLIRKFLARGSAEKKAKIFDKTVNSFKIFDDEEMIPYVEYIRNNYTKEQFMEMSEQEVLQVLRNLK